MSSSTMGRISTYSYTGFYGAEATPQGAFVNKCMALEDGFMVPVILGGMTWEDFASFLGEPALVDARFMTGADRAMHSHELDEIIVPLFARRRKKEMFEAAQEWRFPFGMVQTMEDIAHCPQPRDAGFWTELPLP